MKKTIIMLLAAFLAVITTASCALSSAPDKVLPAQTSDKIADSVDKAEEAEEDLLYLDELIAQSGITKSPLAERNVKFTFRGTTSDLRYERREMSFLYSDDYFKESARTYNQKLAAVSLGLAATAATSYEQEADAYVRDALLQMQFKNKSFRSFKYNTTLNDGTSSVAFAIAHKRIDTDASLVVIAIRGLCYGCEWADNLNVGKGDSHEGFAAAADGIRKELDNYISGQNVTLGGNVKYWIVGFSRAAGVANILAAKLDNTVNPEDVYAYTFATPRTVNVKEIPDATDEKYANVFNICFEADPVPSVVPGEWNFDRYGTTVFLPANQSGDKISALNSAYRKITGSEFDFSVFKGQRLKVNVIMTAVAATFESQDVYSEKYQSTAYDIVYYYCYDTDEIRLSFPAKYNAIFGEKRHLRIAVNKLRTDNTLTSIINGTDSHGEIYNYVCVLFARGMANGLSYDEVRSLIIKLAVPLALYKDSLPFMAQAHRLEIYMTLMLQATKNR